ncbi:MAG: hypothetical protein QXU81_11440 [Candidatus Bathyarchaeia archaeon]
MRAARSILLIAAFLLIYMAVLFLPYIRAQDKGILVEDSDYASTIPIEMPDIPSHIIDIPPRIIVEYADFRSPFNLEAPFGISGIADFIITRVIIEYTDHIQAYELRRPLNVSSTLLAGSRIIIEYADSMLFWNFSPKPVLLDYSPPIIGSVYQRPSEEIYPFDEVTVYANIVDDLSGVKLVILRYARDDGDWIDVEMTNLKEDIYSAVIPKSASNRDVTYMIIAEDYKGNIAMTGEYKYRVLPISSVNIKVEPTSFTISPGEHIALQATLTGISGKPLSKRTVQWLVRSDPELPELSTIISSTIDESGRTAIIYEAAEAPYETQIEICILLSDSEGYTVSRGKIILYPLIWPFIFFVTPLILILIFKVRKLRKSRKSRKRFSIKAKVLSSLLLLLSSFILSYPLKFHENFIFFILSAKTPLWFNVLLLLLFLISALFTIFLRSLKFGIVLGACYWAGIISGLVSPYPYLPSQNFLAKFPSAIVSLSSLMMLVGVLSGISVIHVLVSRITSRYRSPPPSPPRPVPPPSLPPSIKLPPKLPLPSIIQPEDYIKCFQNPHFILDREIRSGEVEEDVILGTPKIISGNFGCVFKVKCGNKTYAVKCWTKQKEDLQRRYKEISNYLKKVKLPYFVTFEYIDEGIMLPSGQKVPILKMEWIDGKRLDAFIEENLNKPDVLQNLAEKFINCIIDLQKNKIAHGDLCPENIIIVPLMTELGTTDFKIVLVDYDCLYIPAFSGEKAPELGHDNYQHPKRSKKHYNERLDNFASLIIYLSLLALSSEPDLWDKYHEEERYLIIKRSDLESPQNSEVIKCLKKSKSSKVRKLTDMLLDALNEDPLSEKINPEKMKRIPG